jgi:hypothetical protein
MSSTVSDSSYQEETFQQKRAVRIYMPDRLKSLLVDDWENITKNLQLVQLPASKPAAIILDEYFAFATSTGSRNSTETDILEEVIQGLKEYFNKALGRLLLYRFEREQFYDISQQVEQPTHDFAGKSMSEIYGGEHLLRLFGKSLSDMSRCPHLQLLTSISLYARADRPDQHGCPSYQPSSRRAQRHDDLAIKGASSQRFLLLRVREPRTGLHRQGQEQHLDMFDHALVSLYLYHYFSSISWIGRLRIFGTRHATANARRLAQCILSLQHLFLIPNAMSP